jgi:hypothetical protein
LGSGGQICHRTDASPVRLAPVALDDELLEDDERCIECGAKLTASELQAVMEGGGPPLCSIHAAEDEPGLEVDEDDFG